MHRCLQLARLGAGSVTPNPMVGAVLVHEGCIIGEGYHAQYGAAHAEVNCFNNVRLQDREKIPSATLYVSLEPCDHFGKTPPCTALILKEAVGRVVIGCRDRSEKVNGKGIEKLEAAGVQVITPVLEAASLELNKRFFCLQEKKRPYIFLKWAATADGFIAGENGTPLAISNDLSNRITHKMRAEEAAILVGFRTALNDNPSLTARQWAGPQPLRIVIDMQLRLPHENHLFQPGALTMVMNGRKDTVEGNLHFFKTAPGAELIPALLHELFLQGKSSLIVEGGTHTLQQFIDRNCWDEALVITNSSLKINAGILAPTISSQYKTGEATYISDRHSFYKNPAACSFS